MRYKMSHLAIKNTPPDLRRVLRAPLAMIRERVSGAGQERRSWRSSSQYPSYVEFGWRGQLG